MRKMGKENIIVVCTIVLCFMLTLAMCMVFSGDGLIQVFSPKGVDEMSVYAIAVGGYNDMILARQSADLIKQRGGAGYVYREKDSANIEIIYAVYKSEQDAKSVLSKLDDKGLYIKEIVISKGKFSWCDKAYKSAVKSGLEYFDIAFSSLYEISNSLNANEMSIDDAKAQIRVLYNQIEDIKSVFYKMVADYDHEQITQIKLAIVTTLALFENINYAQSLSLCVADIRYQIVQLVFCRQALMNGM